MNDPLFNDISEKTKSKIRIVDGPNQFDLKEIKNGLIAIHAKWSGSSVMYGKIILKIVDESPRTDCDILILDIDKLNPDQQTNYLGFFSRGYFEGVWIENGEIVCKNEYGKGIISFYQFRDTIKKVTTVKNDQNEHVTSSSEEELFTQNVSVDHKIKNKNTKELTLYDYSINWNQKDFDKKNINKPISELSLEDYNWCLRNRYFLNQIIDLTVYQIEKNWDKIDQYYPSRVCQWYDEAIKEIITIPFEFWEYRIDVFKKIQYAIKSLTKRKLEIEDKIVKVFINHNPQPKNWTINDSNKFLEDLGYAEALDLAGNLIEAFNQIKKIKYAIMYGQSVYVEPAYKSISSEEELYEFIRDEYFELEELVEEHIIELLKKEKLIKL